MFHGRVVVGGTSDFKFVERSIVYFARGTSRSFCERFEIIVVSLFSIAESLANSCWYLRLSFVLRISASARDRNSALPVWARSAGNKNQQGPNPSWGSEAT